MKTLEEVLELTGAYLDRPALEAYIVREWVRPVRTQQGWFFEEIDIARLHLIHHLSREIEINDQGMDIVLSLLDQLYGLRGHMKRLTHAVTRQPQPVQDDIMTLIRELMDR